jgi:hypothetical protein
VESTDGGNSAEMAYLGLEITVGDALLVDILQACGVRGRNKNL